MVQTFPKNSKEAKKSLERMATIGDCFFLTKGGLDILGLSSISGMT